ncbi:MULTISPECIES: phage tail tape measure protein [Klebsiella]|uniref:tail protein n=1 Tax=Klebsiella TaxID=570 RepID=UPI000667FCAA|nr:MULTISPECIES: tail protein [Klebsiella]EGT0068973.1 phage tail protein [Klebsiella michiganensis]MBZ7337483.1 phage tail protein [Klebsiella grimontii]MCW9443464.1 phage tail protein [Klebsiella oxytoca]WDI68253.1 phage tail protein [Klebsiella grimontii]SYT14725.1 Phage-related minor tail protein [Klebsiella pneumoniae]
MANRLTTEILINLAGNLTAKARQYGANMSEFARTNQRAMNVVRATSAAAGRAIDSMGSRYTGMIAGLGSSLTIKNVADFDAQMRRMGTDAQLTAEQVNELRERIREVSNEGDIRVEASALGQGAGELLGLTGDEKFTKENMRNLGLAMQAFGVDGKTAAGLLAAFWEKNVRGADDVSKMLDKLYAQFAVGSVSVADIARVAPKLFSIISAQGPEALTQMGAFAQVFAKTKGSADEVVTSIQAMYASLQDKKNIKFLQRQGIDVFKPGSKEFKLPFELMKEILVRAKFDPLKLQDVFDQTGMQGINALLKPENMKLMQELIYGAVEYGATQKAAKTNAEGFNAALQSLNNEWQRFAESNLAEPVQELADALNSVDHDTVQNWLNVGKNIAIAGASIIAARKAFQLGKGAWDLFGGGKSKGIPKGVSDVFGSGVMPVYVVNMGAGGMGGASNLPGGSGGAGDGAGAGSGRMAKVLRGVGKVAAPVVGAVALYDELENQYKLPGRIDDLTRQTAEDNNAPPEDRDFASQSQRNRQYMARKWESLKNWFNSISNDPQIADPRPWASMQPQNQPGYPFLQQPELKGSIEVSVKDDRVQVTSVKVNAPGVTMSAGTGLRSTEQD